MPLLDRILELTRQVEERVDRGDWLQAGTLDMERRQLLEDLVAGDGLQKLAPAARAALQEILARNQHTVAKVQAQQKQLAAASSQLNRASGAVRAYRANAGPLAPTVPPASDEA